MPWYGWAYLGLLCLIGAGGFVAGLRAGRARLAFLHLAAVTVLAWGVALYFRGEGAGIAHGLALLCAIAVLARKSFADMRLGESEQLSPRSEEHTSEIQSLMCISYAGFCLKKKKKKYKK